MTKAYVTHRGWLGVNEVEVTIEGYSKDRCIVKAVEGHPFDLWTGASNIPDGARVRYHNDTYWYDAKIVPLSAVRVESDATDSDTPMIEDEFLGTRVIISGGEVLELDDKNDSSEEFPF